MFFNRVLIFIRPWIEKFVGTVGTVRLKPDFKTADIDLQVIPCWFNTIQNKLGILCQEQLRHSSIILSEKERLQ